MATTAQRPTPAQARALVTAITDAQHNRRDYADFFSTTARADMIARMEAAGWVTGTGRAAHVTDAGRAVVAHLVAARAKAREAIAQIERETAAELAAPVTPGQAIDAALKLGEARTRAILGGDLSAAAPEALRRLVTEAAATPAARPRMKIARTGPGRYYGRGAAHSHTIQGGPHGWLLTIAPTTLVAGVQVADTTRRPAHDDFHPTRELAAAVARAFEDLGDDYQPAAHGHRARGTEAVRRAYAADAAR